jgi:hypothetical protein
MIHQIDYVIAINGSQKQHPLMARIALNRLYDPAAFPVDLSELQELDGALPPLLTWAFLDRCATTPEAYWDEEEFGRLKEIACGDLMPKRDPNALSEIAPVGVRS